MITVPVSPGPEGGWVIVRVVLPVPILVKVVYGIKSPGTSTMTVPVSPGLAGLWSSCSRCSDGSYPGSSYEHAEWCDDYNRAGFTWICRSLGNGRWVRDIAPTYCCYVWLWKIDDDSSALSGSIGKSCGCCWGCHGTILCSGNKRRKIKR